MYVQSAYADRTSPGNKVRWKMRASGFLSAQANSHYGRGTGVIKTIVAATRGYCVTSAAIRHCSAKHIELLISDDAATFVSLFAPTSAADASRGR
jgi:hypothetical protein